MVVPDVIGDTYEVARKKLMDAKLKVGNTFPEGREGHQVCITDQAPKPGMTVDEDTPVDLFFENQKRQAEIFLMIFRWIINDIK